MASLFRFGIRAEFASKAGVSVTGIARTRCADKSAADRARAYLELYLPTSAALADDAHKETAEAVIEPLDVSQHAHGRMVLTVGGGVYAIRDSVRDCMGLRLLAIQWLTGWGDLYDRKCRPKRRRGHYETQCLSLGFASGDKRNRAGTAVATSAEAFSCGEDYLGTT